MMKRLAQGEQQKMDILSNEMVRRLSNVCNQVEFAEKIGIIDHYTNELKNSGYSWTEAREAVSCGLQGFLNKCEGEVRLEMDFTGRLGRHSAPELEKNQWRRHHGSRERRKEMRQRY